MINLSIHTQPDDETCGPTSLHAIYAWYGLPFSLDSVICEVERAHSGGTLASLLGKHALARGFKATLYVNNLSVFDPTWFQDGSAKPEVLIKKLTTQMRYKTTRHFIQASSGYLNFVKMGGVIRFETLTKKLLRTFFEREVPVLTGLSATYLYQSKREKSSKGGISVYDDIRGKPCGHFVVLCGYDEVEKTVIVADPHRENPLSHDNYYHVNIQRLINAILLGVLTYDANLLIIEPKEEETQG